MNVQVVTTCDKAPVASYYYYKEYLESLRRFGETPEVLGWGQEWRGLISKPFWLREWLRAGKNTSDRLIVTDAFDILFVKHPHGIGDDCQRIWGDAIVFNGEKGCWPREDLRDCFPDNGSPWRFLNSGFMCGPADKILELVEAMDIDKVGFDPPGGPVYPNDQERYQSLYSEQPVKMVVDDLCQVSQTLSACEMDEFKFTELGLFNKATGTYPGVLHCNGNAKDLMMGTLLDHYNLR